MHGFPCKESTDHGKIRMSQETRFVKFNSDSRHNKLLPEMASPKALMKNCMRVEILSYLCKIYMLGHGVYANSV